MQRVSIAGATVSTAEVSESGFHYDLTCRPHHKLLVADRGCGQARLQTLLEERVFVGVRRGANFDFVAEFEALIGFGVIRRPIA